MTSHRTFQNTPTSEAEIPRKAWFDGEAPTLRETLIHNAPWAALLVVAIGGALRLLA